MCITLLKEKKFPLYETILIMSLPIDGFLLNASVDFVLEKLSLQFATILFLVGYLLGFAPIIVKTIINGFEKHNDETSKLVLLTFIVASSVGLVLEMFLRLYNTYQDSYLQNYHKTIVNALLLAVLVIVQFVSSRRDIIKTIKNRPAAKELRIIANHSLIIAHKLSLTLLRVSCGLFSLAISFDTNTILFKSITYSLVLLMLIMKAVLFKSQIFIEDENNLQIITHTTEPH
jgi:hypothetical protein